MSLVRAWISGEHSEIDESFWRDVKFIFWLGMRIIIGWPVYWALWITYWAHHFITIVVDKYFESDDELNRRSTREAVEEWRRNRKNNSLH